MGAVELVSFVPYRRTADGWEFYLQMRDGNAPTHRNMFSTFGGHLEDGEDSRTGLLREVQEELVYEPKHMEMIWSGALNEKTFDIYVEEVPENFESHVTVLEGEYGMFLSLIEVRTRADVTDLAKYIVERIVARRQ